MKQITLIEDSCLGQNKDFNKEKQILLNKGYTIVSEINHLAVGRICKLQLN
jgi:hypothetical protein